MFGRLARLLLCIVAVSAPIRAGATDLEGLHFAPVENLERIDVALIDSARVTLDLAAYVLTDRPVIDALIAAEARGVAIRILLDPSQKHAADRLAPLAADIRLKRRGPIMHLKAYVVDGEVLRTGSANFSASGLKQQDNDLLITREPALVTQASDNFDRAYGIGLPYQPAGADPGKASDARPGGVDPVTTGTIAPPPVPGAEPPGDVRSPTATSETAQCLIKGNVGRSGGRIYHLPGQADYDKVTIDGRAGKRWFCSEAEAAAAGWRKALR